MIAERLLKEIRERLRFLVDVGLDYLSLARPAGTLAGGEAQRIRLATQIGSGLVGVLYILDEPSIGLHQRDNQRLIDTLIRLRDLGNTLIVVEHDEATILEADHIVDIGPLRGGARRRDRLLGRPEGAARVRTVDHRSVPRGPPADPHARASPQAHQATPAHRRGPRAQPEERHGRHPAGHVRLRHRGVRQRQVHAGPGRPAPRADAEGLPVAAPARPLQEARRLGADRQGHRHRPVADRAHPAVEPGHLHRRVRPRPQALRAGARSAAARLPARALLLQRAGRPMRELRGRRPDQDRDALPARRLRHLRGVQGAAVQPRDARGEVQGPLDQRRPRDEHRRGARVLPEHPGHQAAHADPVRRRAGLREARPAGAHAVRAARPSGSSSAPSCTSAPPATRSTSSTNPPPACTSRTCASSSACCSGWSTRATPCW